MTRNIGTLIEFQTEHRRILLQELSNTFECTTSDCSMLARFGLQQDLKDSQKGFTKCEIESNHSGRGAGKRRRDGDAPNQWLVSYEDDV